MTVLAGITPSSIPSLCAMEPAITLRTMTSIGMASTLRHTCSVSESFSMKCTGTPALARILKISLDMALQYKPLSLMTALFIY